MQDFKRVLNPGKVKSYTQRGGEILVPLFVSVEFKDSKLSITGVEGPQKGGSCYGSCGQCVDALDRIEEFSTQWDPGACLVLRDIWNAWHLNDMRAGCEHQRAEKWGAETLEVVSYKLTSEALEIRKHAKEQAEAAAINGETADLFERERALLACKWFESIFEPPDADSPLSGCYEVDKREEKLANWTKESEHPRGVLSKPCPTCGYCYGSAWLKEEVPETVLAVLRGLPETTITPAWI